jgi:NADH dehydrogenase FAD-containing subunit
VLKTDGSPNPDVIAIGDAAKIENNPLPATAQGQLLTHPQYISTCAHRMRAPYPVAYQKAKYTSKKLNKIVKDQEYSKPFQFKNQGSLAYIGDWFVMYHRTT